MTKILKRFLYCVLLVASSVQGAPGLVSDGKVFFLWEEPQKQWCGYASEAQYTAGVEEAHPLAQGFVQFVKGRPTKVIFVQNAVSGDWSIKDNFDVDRNSVIVKVSREIGNLSTFTREEQRFLVRNGRAIRKSIASYDLETGKPTGRLEDVYGTVIGIAVRLPFWTFIREHRNEILKRGKVCAAGSYKR